MSVSTRWVRYDITAAGEVGTGGTTTSGRGTRGYSLATASVSDSFNIGAANNKLYVNADGEGVQNITLASGSDLDPRFVAKDIAEKIHNLGMGTVGWDQSQCVWINDTGDSHFELYSGGLGVSSSMAITSGTNTAHLELGWGTKTENTGAAFAGTGTRGITVSGTYNGFFDETYHIVINKVLNIGTPAKDGGNTYTGAISTGGVFNNATAITYTLTIDTTNGSTMGAGTGNVPEMSWTSTGNVDDGGPVELLYANYWYRVGTKGIMVKFTDAVFNTANPAWTIACTACDEASPGNGNDTVGGARYVYGSNRGDDATNFTVSSDSAWTQLGSRGLYIKFTAGGNLYAGDEYFVICTPPQPSAYDITNLNYGNVTVSTESPVKSVMFEIMSGDAVEISTVKFGLQADGTFTHHDQNNSDTYFRFGTVGPGAPTGGSPIDGLEWRETVTAADISSDVPPSYLFATEDNLPVVADADSSKTIGTSTYAGMVADPIWLNIKLGTSEVGANSTINYRVYFDYS